MPLPDFRIYLRPFVTLTFDLLTLNLIVSCPCPVDHLCRLALTLVHLFSKYHIHRFDNRQVNGQISNVIPLPASLAWSSSSSFLACNSEDCIAPYVDIILHRGQF